MVLSNCGHTDAEAIEEYIARGGYQAVAKALFDMKTDDIVQEVMDSGLRGRGGGGFPRDGSCSRWRSKRKSENSWCATATREIRARSWTGTSWRAIRIR